MTAQTSCRGVDIMFARHGRSRIAALKAPSERVGRCLTVCAGELVLDFSGRIGRIDNVADATEIEATDLAREVWIAFVFLADMPD